MAGSISSIRTLRESGFVPVQRNIRIEDGRRVLVDHPMHVDRVAQRAIQRLNRCAVGKQIIRRFKMPESNHVFHGVVVEPKVQINALEEILLMKYVGMRFATAYELAAFLDRYCDPNRDAEQPILAVGDSIESSADSKQKSVLAFNKDDVGEFGLWPVDIWPARKSDLSGPRPRFLIAIEASLENLVSTPTQIHG